MGTVRRRDREATAAVATTALSLLDIVSAGFGAAVFLFVVFASLPIDARPPSGGGGGRFIDLEITWPRFSATAEFTEDKTSEELVKAGSHRFWEGRGPSSMYSGGFGGLVFGHECGSLSDGEVVRLRRKQDDPIGRGLSPLRFTVGCYRIAQPFKTADQGKRPAREPIVDLHIGHRSVRETDSQTRLSVLAGSINRQTDGADMGDGLPWETLYVTGFDPFGRYTRIGAAGDDHSMFVRVLEPEAGDWGFKAKLYAGGGSGDVGPEPARPPLDVSVTVRCADGSGRGNVWTGSVQLSFDDMKPVELEGAGCQFRPKR